MDAAARARGGGAARRRRCRSSQPSLHGIEQHHGRRNCSRGRKMLAANSNPLVRGFDASLDGAADDAAATRYTVITGERICGWSATAEPALREDHHMCPAHCGGGEARRRWRRRRDVGRRVPAAAAGRAARALGAAAALLGQRGAADGGGRLPARRRAVRAVGAPPRAAQRDPPQLDPLGERRPHRARVLPARPPRAAAGRAAAARGGGGGEWRRALADERDGRGRADAQGLRVVADGGVAAARRRRRRRHRPFREGR